MWVCEHVIDDKVAPALQAAKEKLERSQLEVRDPSLVSLPPSILTMNPESRSLTQLSRAW